MVRAAIMGRAKKGRFASDEAFEAEVTGMTESGDGWFHAQPREIRVPGALPGEVVRVKRVRRDRRFDLGALVEVVSASPDRVEPACSFAGLCSGCSLHHVSHAAQVAWKEKQLLESFRQSGIEVEHLMPPLVGATLHYRRRARLAVRWVEKKGRILVGFREMADSRFIAAIDRCVVLDDRVGGILPNLAELIADLEAFRQIPQIEIAAGDDKVAMIVRVLAPLSASDRTKVQTFARGHQLSLWLAPNPPDPLENLDPDPTASDLCYAIDSDWGGDDASRAGPLRLYFGPRNFVQVNASVNQMMVQQAMQWLAPTKNDSVLDLFCGLGNFTLPLARRCRTVIGVEGDVELVERARGNAKKNEVMNANFEARDLYGPLDDADWIDEPFDRVLLDPPRSGAEQLCQRLSLSQAHAIVYVSCNPVTLARDAAILLGAGRFRLAKLGMMDMFAHTSHLESMALFLREPTA
jgi:23S rRNA (uracil1939-C5)-methyltransferase